jgi:acyl-CoA reductase-like NAD-dependent aldehyde dehydrogenase
MIDGKTVPSISGETFDTKPPIDGTVLASAVRRRRTGGRHDLAQSENVRHLPTPFGGVKSSGIGRDGGDYSFDFYMETKRVSLARGTHRIQRLGV